MIRLLVAAATRFGRLCVLFFVVPALLIGALWLAFLDRYPLVVLASALMVIPMVLLAVALLTGTVFMVAGDKREASVTEAQAPGLWRLWREVAGDRLARRTTLVINDDFNAAIGETRGVFGRRADLFVGLPLLTLLDIRALKAVLAHELAHFRHKDTNGSLKLTELEMSFNAIFDYAPPGTTLSGSVLYWALGPLARAFEKEELRLSRVAELEADRLSATLGDQHETARALILIVAGTELVKERVFIPLQREMLGAISAPRTPMTRILEVAPDMRSAETLQALLPPRAPEDDDDSAMTHPHWRKRLASLGFEEPPAVDPPLSFAVEEMLDAEFLAEKRTALDALWLAKVADYLDR